MVAPPRRRRHLGFILANVVVWLLMTVTMVLVPDTLERWLGLEVARVVGWGVAGSLWMVTIERHWQARVGAIWRFLLQLLIWISAALVAITISDLARW